MNKDQIQGNFEQIKGRAKSVWGELTDDDVRRAEGDADRLYGIIQERFGDTKEAIKKKIDSVQMGSSS